MAGSTFGPYGSTVFGDDRFPNPFLDVASQSMPENIKSALDWCEFIWNHMGTYRSAVRRVNSYFLTEIDIASFDPIDPISDDEKEKYKTFFKEQLDVLLFVLAMLDDRSCYGNAFGSVVVPFKRLLSCSNHCGAQFPIKEVVENKSAFRFDFSKFEFMATCPKCGHRGEWHVKDEADKDEGRLKLKRWNPKEIEILHDFYTEECQYIWRIPEDYKKELAAGNLYTLERAPMEVIKAVKNNWVFRFAPDAIFHMKEPVLAGQRTRGWGIPRTLLNYRQIYYVQVLRRYNEAIALDYVIPFRLITPDTKSGGGQDSSTFDPMLMTDMGDFMGATRAMIKRRAKDPAGWHTLPYPVKYQVLGGDAQALAPRDLLDQGLETLLNETGVPVEMYKGSLTLQTAPVAMRLFEANWHHLVHDMNMFLGWLVRQISQILSWESVKASMIPVNYVDDMNRQMALLQLMMGQSISATTALRSLGIDWKGEQRQLAEESRFQSEQQAEVQEEMEQSAFGQQIAKGQGPGGQPAGGGGQPAQGGAPQGDPAQQGGAPAGPVTGLLQSMGPNTPVTPQDMLAEADSLSQQLMGLPSSQRDSELRALKQKNEVLHSLVKSKMDGIRRQASSAGKSMVLSQQFGQT